MKLRRIFSTLYWFGLAFAVIATRTPVQADSGLGHSPDYTANQEEICRTILTRAMDALRDNCNTMSRNNACYGSNTVRAVLTANTPSKFEKLGDKAPIQAIRSLSTSPLDLQQGTWGISLLKLQANLPDTMPGQSVTFMVFGDTTVENASGNMQAFYFKSGLGSVDCKEAPRDGILVRSPNHTEVTFTANGVQVTIASTVMLQAQPNKKLNIRLLEGRARVTTTAGSQTMKPGEVVSVPMGGGNGLEASGAPSAPATVPIEPSVETLADKIEQYAPPAAPVKIAIDGCVTNVQGNIVTINDYKVTVDPKNSGLRKAKVGDCYSITATVQEGPDQTQVIIPVTVVVNTSASASTSPDEAGTGKKDKAAAKAERKAEKQADKEAKQAEKEAKQEAKQEAKEEKKAEKQAEKEEKKNK
jgi:hypothetical protein